MRNPELINARNLAPMLLATLAIAGCGSNGSGRPDRQHVAPQPHATHDGVTTTYKDGVKTDEVVHYGNVLYEERVFLCNGPQLVEEITKIKREGPDTINTSFHTKLFPHSPACADGVITPRDFRPVQAIPGTFM